VSSNGVSKEAVLGGSSDTTVSKSNGCELKAAAITNGTRPESSSNQRNTEEVVNGTTATLQNGGPSTWQPSRKTHLLSLPTEILCLIASGLDPATTFNLRLACRRLANALPLDQGFWYHALMTGGLFGFFFDFESMKVLDETRRKCLKRGRQPPHWDWKRLVGELARFSSFQNGGVMADAPGAFRNRRRIWCILQIAEDVGREHIEGNTLNQPILGSE
jgi:F-box-like